MKSKTIGKVISLSRQWWLKRNTKPVRIIGTDGALYPYIIKVSYCVDGKEYTKRKWIGAGRPVPPIGSAVTVMYDGNKPARAKVLS